MVEISSSELCCESDESICLLEREQNTEFLQEKKELIFNIKNKILTDLRKHKMINKKRFNFKQLKIILGYFYERGNLTKLFEDEKLFKMLSMSEEEK